MSRWRAGVRRAVSSKTSRLRSRSQRHRNGPLVAFIIVAETDSLSELEWAQQIARGAGWDGEFVVLPSDRAPAHLRWPGNLDQDWVVDTARIREELGYREPIARDEAIRRTIEWERAHPPAQADSDQFEYAAEDIAIKKWISD